MRNRASTHLTQPVEMKTKSYVYGVEKINGYDAWAMFEACALGNLGKVKALLAKDRRLVNAQYWYQLPIHMAVRAGHAHIVKLLLDRSADPGQSRYAYDSWDKLLRCARERGYREIESLLQRAMQKRFNYNPDFDLLKNAIIQRDSRKISAVLRKHPKLARASDALGNNPLHWAVLTRQLGLIERFVDLGTPIDALRADGQTPVLLAVNGSDYWYRDTRGKSHPSIRNNFVIVGNLLARGARYTISVAAAAGDQERIEELVRADPGVAKRLDTLRLSPLSYAAGGGHFHIVHLLLKHGADPNIPEEGAPDGMALYEACVKNHFEIAKLLLEHGANPNAGVDSSECCLTIGSIYHGDQAKPLQKLLRQYGAYIPPYRMNAEQMKRAIRSRHKVVQHEEFLGNVLRTRNQNLIDMYLDTNPAVLKHMQFWGGIVYPKSAALVRRLLARGLDPNARDWLGRTLLHDCAANGDTSVAAVLLDGGADINARDAEFKGTPLATAVRGWCTETDFKQNPRRRRAVEFLLKRGAALDLPGDEPWATPLAWAKRHGRREIVQTLKANV